ncbi:MAG: ABC transporter substrate-binding protein [Alphaproteobacteria bacterium]|nr:ABC transporter substrate-binding protein [Alphaproteobacteria bacterium]
MLLGGSFVTNRKVLLSAAAFAALAALGSAGAGAQERTFIFASVATPVGFDTDRWLSGTLESAVNVYEGLTKHAVKKDASGREVIDADVVEPHLAESWTQSEGGKVVTYKLRKGIKSAFGNDLTAQDVVNSWDMARDRKLVGAFMITVGRVAKVEALSESEVKFTLGTANNIFPRVLTTIFPALMDSKVQKENATADDKWATKWQEKATAGFGPYHLESVKPGEGAVFVLNKNYFGPKPYYTRVVYREVPSPATRAALVKTGQIHFADQMPIQQLVDLIKDKNVKVDSVPGTGAATLRMNPNLKPFDDIRVRRAVLAAMDYAAVGEAVFRGLGERSWSILAPAHGNAYIEAQKASTDLGLGKKLLTEAGYPGGLDVTFEYADNWWWEEQLAIQTKDSLAKAGIRVDLKRIPRTEMNTRRAIGKRDLPFFPHLANAFVLAPAYAFYLSAHSQGSSNVNDYKNPEFDRMVDDMIGESDTKRANQLAHEAQRIHANDATFVLTHFPKTYAVTVPCITGWLWYPHDRVVWKHLTCDEKKS